MVALAGTAKQMAGRMPAWVWPLLAAAAFMLAALGVVIAVGAMGEPPEAVLRDPAAHYDYPWYGGLVSAFGVVIMAGSAAILAFTLVLVREAPPVLWAAAVLTAVLTVDDLVMVHDWILPNLVGIPEKASMAAYALVFLVLLWRHGLQSPGWEKSGFYLALGLMAAAVLIDRISPQPVWLTIAEDVAKAGAFAAWAAYWTYVSHAVLHARLRPPLS